MFNHYSTPFITKEYKWREQRIPGRGLHCNFSCPNNRPAILRQDSRRCASSKKSVLERTGSTTTEVTEKTSDEQTDAAFEPGSASSPKVRSQHQPYSKLSLDFPPPGGSSLCPCHGCNTSAGRFRALSRRSMISRSVQYGVHVGYNPYAYRQTL